MLRARLRLNLSAHWSLRSQVRQPRRPAPERPHYSCIISGYPDIDCSAIQHAVGEHVGCAV